MDDAEVERKRALIKGAYSSQSWEDKVARMSPAQVTAVYIRLSAQGKLGK